ncbi:MAG: hypothetical protein ACK5X3_07415, partial [Pseudomonadota bacterium]
RDADHRVYHPGVSDQPDPHASPDPRLPDRAGRRAPSPINPETVWAGRLATTGGGAPSSLNLTPTPRRRAGTFGTRDRPTGASTRSPPAPHAPRGPRPVPLARGEQGARTPRGRSSPRRRAVVYSTGPDSISYPLDRLTSCASLRR